MSDAIRDRISKDAAEAREVIAQDAAEAKVLVGLDAEEIARRFRSILDGFKAEEAERERLRRRRVKKWIFAVVVVFILIVGAISVVHTQNAQTRWDNQNTAHAACLARAEGRESNKKVIIKVISDLSNVVDAKTVPIVLQYAAAEKQALAELLPPINCNVEAPKPSGDRPEWPS